MKPVLLALALIAAAPLAAAAQTATTTSTAADRALQRCRAEIGWSRMTAAQQASADTRFRLQFCLKRAAVR
jgi:hypothetical protein